MGGSLVSGLASAFLVYGTVVDDTTIKSKVGLHISVGNNAKAAGTPKASISGQISTLRALLQNAQANKSRKYDECL